MPLTVVFQFENREKNREIPNEISETYIEQYQHRLLEPPVQLIENKIYVDMNNPKLPEWIKNFREYHSWTQNQLKDLSNVSLQYISQIERGTFSPAVGTVKKLLHAFLEEGHQMHIHELLPEVPSFIDPDESETSNIYATSSGIMDFKGASKSNIDFQCIEDIIDDTLTQIKDTRDYGLLSLALFCLQLILKIKDFREYKTTNDCKENFISRYTNQLANSIMLLFKSK